MAAKVVLLDKKQIPKLLKRHKNKDGGKVLMASFSILLAPSPIHHVFQGQ